MNFQIIYDAPEVQEMKLSYEVVGIDNFQKHLDDAILTAIEIFGEAVPSLIVIEVVKILDGYLRQWADKKVSKPATSRMGRILRGLWNIRQLFGSKAPANNLS